MEKEQVALQVIEAYPSDVRLVYHHLPNESDLSMKIAEALEAAGAQDKFWELHDRLIEDVPENIDELRVAANDVGLDMGLFDEAIETGQYAEVVAEAIQLAKDDGLESTGLYVAKVEYTKYPVTFDDLRKVIDAGLAAAEEGSEGN